jgi:hypothetical protein
MMSDGGPSAVEEASPAQDHDGQSGSEINLEQLADKVYRLFVAEIRLGRARGETVRGGRG